MKFFRRIAALIALVTGPVAFAQVMITTTSLPYGAVGSNYNAKLGASGGMGNYVWEYQGGLPAGLNFGDDGSITGIPQVGGNYSLSVTVVSPDDSSATANIPLSILAITTSAKLPSGSTGRAYYTTFSGTGSPDQLVWTTSTAPPGLTLDPNGTLSGTPTTPGNFKFNVQALSNAAGIVLNQDFNLSIAAVLSITTASPLPPAYMGAAYTQTLTANYGAVPYTFALASGVAGNALPAGLTLSAGGTISGTPTVSGKFIFGVTVTDSQSSSATSQLQLTIDPALVILTNSLNSGSAGAVYNQSIQASGGTQPYVFTVSGSLPAGLSLSSAGVLNGTANAAGTFPIAVKVTDSLNFSVSKQFSLTIAGASALLQVSPTQLSFAAIIGGDAPAPQAISIQSVNGRPVNFAATVVGSTAATAVIVPTWLTVSPASGAAPGNVIVSVNPAGLNASPSPAAVQISVPGNTSQAPIAVTVSLSLTLANPSLTVTPSSLRFVARSQTAIQERLITVSNAGGSVLGITASILNQSSWLTVTPTAGQTSQNSPVVLRVDANTQGLSVGNHHDVVHIVSTAGTIDVPVSVFVPATGAIMSLNVNGVRFPARQGAGTTTPETISVLNIGDPTTTVHWSATLQSGSDWLSISPGSGTASATSAGTLTLTPLAATANFATGPRYALIDVYNTDTANSHQYITAVLDVQASSTSALPDLAPAGYYFATATNATPPAAQGMKVYTSSTTPVSFGVATSTTDGGSWLTATPSSSAASTAAPGTVAISVNATGLAAGIYTGGVSVSMSGVVRTANVTMEVNASPVTSKLRPEDSRAIGCNPSKLAVTQTSLVNNFAVPAGWPATLIVQLNDDCGDSITNGTVVASFSNGDPPLTLSGDNQTPMYSATWQPSAVLPNMAVTIRASSPGLPNATQQFVGAVNGNPTTPPSLYANGTLNIFFNAAAVAAVGDGIAPGTVVQVYGTGLAATATSTGTIPLQNNFNGTFMLIGGYMAPLFYVSPGLLDAQIPFELTPNQQYSVLVSSNGALTPPQTLDVVSLQPGVLFSPTDGSIIAQHFPSYSLVTAASPAKPGENLVMYLSGMGATNPSVASGNPTPAAAVPTNIQPTVTVDGQNASVGYAGLTPTGIGLYQINFVVPANAKNGNLSVVVTQNGIVANTTTLPVSN